MRNHSNESRNATAASTETKKKRAKKNTNSRWLAREHTSSCPLRGPAVHRHGSAIQQQKPVQPKAISQRGGVCNGRRTGVRLAPQLTLILTQCNACLRWSHAVCDLVATTVRSRVTPHTTQTTEIRCGNYGVIWSPRIGMCCIIWRNNDRAVTAIRLALNLVQFSRH